MNHPVKKVEISEFCALREKFGFAEACNITRARLHRHSDAEENPHVIYPLDNFDLWDTPQDKETRERCSRCDVKVPCLHFAVEVGLPNHVYGGLNHAEREPLERRFNELFGPDAPPIIDDVDLSQRESEFWNLLEAQVEYRVNAI